MAALGALSSTITIGAYLGEGPWKVVGIVCAGVSATVVLFALFLGEVAS